MSTTATPEHTAHAEKQAAALSSVLAALAITLLKLLTGILAGSIGMLSEAAHSGVDLIASAITLFSVRASDRPADDIHNYGHGKIESLSAFVESVIMLGSCIWIITTAIQRIVHREHLSLTFSIWPFLVLLLSIAVDYTRSRNLHRVARDYSSVALEADALHFGTDIWSSFAVLIGLGASFAGQYCASPPSSSPTPSLPSSSPSSSSKSPTPSLAAPSTPSSTRPPAENSDATASETRYIILRDLAAIPGVLSVDRLRTRRSGSSYFADITLGLPRNLTFQRSEQITSAATQVIQRHLPGADVVVHSVPTASLAESVHDRIRAVAARSNLNIHDVTVQQFDDSPADNPLPSGSHSVNPQPGALHVEQHLEVDESMSLLAAHALVTQLESDMRREIPRSPPSSPTSSPSPPPSSAPPPPSATASSKSASAAPPRPSPRSSTSTTSSSPAPTRTVSTASRSTAIAHCQTTCLWLAFTRSSPPWKTLSNWIAPRSPASSSTPNPPPITAADTRCHPPAATHPATNIRRSHR